MTALVPRSSTVATSFGPGTQASRKGLAIAVGLSFEDWLAVGERLVTEHESSKFWIGDWLVYGEWGGYGDGYRQVLEYLDLAYDTVRQYAYVAGHVPVAIRRDDLSWRHHLVVAKLKPSDQQPWLQRAAENRWSSRTLAAEIAAARPPLDPPTRPPLESPAPAAASGARAPDPPAPGAAADRDLGAESLLAQVSFSTLKDRVAAWEAAAAAEGLDLASWLIAAGDARAGFTPEP